MYNALLAALDEFERKQISVWEDTVEETSQSTLRRPLLTRVEDPSSPRCPQLGLRGGFEVELRVWTTKLPPNVPIGSLPSGNHLS